MNMLKLGLVVATAALAGCATPRPVARHAPEMVVSGTAPGASAVFAETGVQSPGWEYGRRDAQIAVREPQTLFEHDSWENVPAPDLGSVRQVTISRTPETVTYFRRTRVPESRTYWGGW